MDNEKTKELEKKFSAIEDDEFSDNENDEGEMSDDFDDSESSDDDHVWTQKVKEEHKKLRQEAAIQKRVSKQEKMVEKIAKMTTAVAKKPQFFELKEGESLGKTRKHKKNKTIAERLEQDRYGFKEDANNNNFWSKAFCAKKIVADP